MTDAQYKALDKKIDEVLNVVNHHLRGDLKDYEKKNMGTERNLALNRVVYLTAGRVNSLEGEMSKVMSKLGAMNKVLSAQTKQNNTLGRMIGEARTAAQTVPQRLVAFRVPFQANTSLGRLFGKDFRFGALLGYAGASFVDRDQHTKEIVSEIQESIDLDALEVGEVHETPQIEIEEAGSQADAASLEADAIVAAEAIKVD